MALPVRLARYQSLLDLLVDAALREMDGEAEPVPESADTNPPAASPPAHAPDAEGRAP